jgi:hypothetical protein
MTPARLAQRRAAKAQRRKAIIRARRKEEMGGRHVLILSDETLAQRPAMEKASAALLELADPLLALAQDREEMHKALGLALLAWNLSLMPVNERMEEMAVVGEKLVPESTEEEPVNRAEFLDEFRELMAALISRKFQLFPLDHRQLADVQVVDNGSNGCHVTVKSLLEVAA